MTQLKMEYTFAVFTAIPPLLLFMATLNISHVEGMASDFSNILLEIVTSNSSYFIDYSSNTDGAKLMDCGKCHYSRRGLFHQCADWRISMTLISKADVPVIEISYSEAFLPDFSNLHVHFVSSEASEEIGYTFISMEEGNGQLLAWIELQQTMKQYQ